VHSSRRGWGGTGGVARAPSSPTWQPSHVRADELAVFAAAGEAQIATRIRVSAEACARPQVRIALAEVADGEMDDGAIEDAIAEDERARA
jgi:hypothetical protein